MQCIEWFLVTGSPMRFRHNFLKHSSHTATTASRSYAPNTAINWKSRRTKMREIPICRRFMCSTHSFSFARTKCMHNTCNNAICMHAGGFTHRTQKTNRMQSLHHSIFIVSQRSHHVRARNDMQECDLRGPIHPMRVCAFLDVSVK